MTLQIHEINVRDQSETGLIPYIRMTLDSEITEYRERNSTSKYFRSMLN